MAIPFDQPTVCPMLIGRDAHLAALLHCLDQAVAGHGRTVLLTGEGGIGKSRLVAEAKPAAARAGFLILEGACFEPDRALPYAPIVDLLHASFSPSDETGPAAPALRALLLELTTWLPAAGPDPSFSPEREKHRRFAALDRLFAQLAATQPLLAIVEDVHWSDETSLEFLLLLARRLATRPILLLLTYRGDEVDEGLARFLAELDRARLAAEIRLTRLADADVGAMIRAIFASQRHHADPQPWDPADLVAAVCELTDGNPFFVEEIVRSLVADGASQVGATEAGREVIDQLRIPRSVEEAVRRRAARVSWQARHVLTLAAVAGRRFDVPLLQALTGHNETALLSWLKELIAAGLVVEESAEHFAFRHALTRQAIYTGLLAQERKALHRDIAETMEPLEAGGSEHRLADLAYHHAGAGHWAQALDYSRRAGQAAQHLHAPRAAIMHFTRALDAAERLSRLHPPSLYVSRVHDSLPADLYLGRGRAYEITGDFERARADNETALRSAELASDRRDAWQALMALGLLWAERDYERTGDYYRRAADLAETLADPGLLARSLNRLGNWLANTGRPAEALRAHQQALALVTAQGDERAIAETQDLLGMAFGIAHGDAIAAADHFAQASERFRALGDPFALASSLTSLGTYRCPGGSDETLFTPLAQQDECAQLFAEALRLARQVEWLGGQAYAEFAWGRALAAFGEFGESLVHAERSLAIATESAHQQWACAARCILGAVHLAMLAPDKAIPHLEIGCALARDMGAAWWASWGITHLALAHLARGAPALAEATLAALLPPDQRPRNVGERWLVWGWGEIALANGQPGAALNIADVLLDSVPGPAYGQPIPALLKLKGEALIGLGNVDEAAAVLHQAQRGAEERGVRPLLWQVHRAQARLHRARKEYAAARRACAAARAVIAPLAATIDDTAARDHFVRAATRSLPALPKGKPPSPRRLEAARFDGLTRREREVAVEIAHGKSNREIAASLFTAERTIASHVGNILAKLHFTARSQIAVWARDKGLTTNNLDSA